MKGKFCDVALVFGMATNLLFYSSKISHKMALCFTSAQEKM